jgi:hypothetical protein
VVVRVRSGVCGRACGAESLCLSTTGDKPKWRVYFWEGKDASSLRFPMFVLGLQPLLEEKILRSGSPKPEVERIYQGKEPLAFMKMFERMISISKGTAPDTHDTQHDTHTTQHDTRHARHADGCVKPW